MLQGLAGLATLGGAAAIAGFLTFGFGPDVTEAMSAGQSIAVKDAVTLARAPSEADDAQAAPALSIPAAAIVDASLLDPQPMVVASVRPVRTISYPAPSAANASDFADQQVTGSLPFAADSANRHAAAVPVPIPAPAAKKPTIVPRLERDGTLSLAQIASIKASLNLSPDQEQHWAPVEAELREIARQLAAQKASGRKPTLALGANEAQRLYWAAGPLIMSLREDQKREVRALARAMGLEQVASLI
jgi:hypothetical protein